MKKLLQLRKDIVSLYSSRPSRILWDIFYIFLNAGAILVFQAAQQVRYFETKLPSTFHSYTFQIIILITFSYRILWLVLCFVFYRIDYSRYSLLKFYRVFYQPKYYSLAITLNICGLILYLSFFLHFSFGIFASSIIFFILIFVAFILIIIYLLLFVEHPFFATLFTIISFLLFYNDKLPYKSALNENYSVIIWFLLCCLYQGFFQLQALRKRNSFA